MNFMKIQTEINKFGFENFKNIKDQNKSINQKVNIQIPKMVLKH